MSWRTVVVSSHCKLEYKLGYLVCRGEETKKIYLSDISTLIIESTAVAITTALLCELIRNNINVIFCDDKHNPHSQLLPLNGKTDTSGALRRQIAWSSSNKERVAREILRLKIERQCALLKKEGMEESKSLDAFLSESYTTDIIGLESPAAKVYFSALFGNLFRRRDDTFVNSLLNYGYAIIMSAFSREIVAEGYNTHIGIFHCNEFNNFNLTCDLMEPFRIIVDEFVIEHMEEFDSNFKHLLCNILNVNVSVNGHKCTVTNAIETYCRSVFDALESPDDFEIKINCYEL